MTIISSGVTDVHHTFLAHVTRSWTFDSQNCSRFENHDLILIRTSYSHCTRCPDFNTTAGSNFYLIAGYCNDRGWYLPPNDSLVSPWHSNSKYPSRLENWIQNGIDARTQNWKIHTLCIYIWVCFCGNWTEIILPMVRQVCDLCHQYWSIHRVHSLQMCLNFDQLFSHGCCFTRSIVVGP